MTPSIVKTLRRTACRRGGDNDLTLAYVIFVACFVLFAR